MIELDFSDGFAQMEKAVLKIAEASPTAIAKALTRTAVGVMGEVRRELPTILDRPIPFTVSSIRYGKATRSDLNSRVYISDDAPKGLSPRKYLKAEIEGGPRGDKRSEKSMKAMGVLGGGQQWVAGRGADLDAFGNVPGSQMVQIMSRVAGFRDGGYRANATASTRNRLIRQGVAVTANGFDFFVKRGKGGRPLGIYKIVSAGTKATPGVRGTSVRAAIQPALIFVNKRPDYKPRFHFEEIVGKAARVLFPQEMMRALTEEIARRK